jgi:uncharacterized protein
LALSNVDVRYYAPAFRIEMNGKELQAEISHLITGISIEQELKETNQFSFTVQDQMSGGKFTWLGHDLFKYGNLVEIYLGYPNDMKMILKGKVQNIAAEFREGLAPTFTVSGADVVHEPLTIGRDTEVFKDKKDSEIASYIARKISMEPVVDKTKDVFPVKIKKAGVTYLDFLKDLAKRNSFEFYLGGRQMYFIKSRKDLLATLTLSWGQGLLNFRPTINTAQLLSEVVVRGWDTSAKSRIEARAKAGEEQKQEDNKRLASQIAGEIYESKGVKVIADRPVSSVSEAKQIAMSELEKANEGFIRGSAEIVGIPGLAPGGCLNLDGLGSWFSGKYYIEKVTHKIDQGYRCSLELKRNAI